MQTYDRKFSLGLAMSVSVAGQPNFSGRFIYNYFLPALLMKGTDILNSGLQKAGVQAGAEYCKSADRRETDT
ncbi:Uncharacterised protein [Chlamydia abortus]|uniref:hypothetical protein n=1 Tax=Paenibacillus sp. 32O-W TaxID=1695218 RepID=UPI000A27DC8C|nr:hypothetical protein [Paenibacillus sp. 32O-W]SHE13418.1 Uncharacterised protein [Chlamydia abortus]